MTSTIAQMLDPGALAIVLSGTVIATAARCGWSDMREAASALGSLGESRFDADENRVALARTVHEIEAKGPLGAEASLPPDPSLAKVVDAYLRHRSIEAMHTVRRAERAAREMARSAAIRTFEYAGELAPVFGLVGTLFAITQLTPGESDVVGSTMGAIATAVLSTLYGVLTAHLIFIPLARAIERQGEEEERAREHLIEWLGAHLRDEELVHVPHIQELRRATQ
ncbi:MotA/TolQ/ExbB proton channel family protein [uncultured Erythrobacter sp.]|uniref:MotA/TolQ/ExbB proton channel family protein n=1 Tax=uncultured Erythrobacter sp. TaxID=263913 RepID=UPI0026114A2D|nr:MotA/TolQ/ExbB proton channel family protein [uncultured Erythrobacter sp.]